MSTYATPVKDDVVPRLIAAIEAREQNHLAHNDRVAMLRHCKADREIVGTYLLVATKATNGMPDLHADAWMVMRHVIDCLATAYDVEGPSTRGGHHPARRIPRRR